MSVHKAHAPASSRRPHVNHVHVALLAVPQPQLLCDRGRPRQVLIEVVAEHRIVKAWDARLV